MKIKSKLLLVAFLLVTFTSFSQLTRGYKAAMQKRALIVVIITPPDDVKADVTKWGYLDYYQGQYDQYNKNVKEAFDKYWKQGDVQYKTVEQLSRIPDKEHYAIFYPRSDVTSLKKREFYEYTIYPTKSMIKDSASVGMWYSPNPTKIFLDTLDTKRGHGLKVANAFELPVLQLFPTRVELFNIVYKLNAFCEKEVNECDFNWYYAQQSTKYAASHKPLMDKMNSNHLKLKYKTLLLDRKLLDPGLTEADIKQVYPYPFKIVSSQEVENRVVAKDSTYAYLYNDLKDITTAYNSSSHYSLLYHVIKDAANNELLSPPVNDRKALLKKKTLQKLANGEAEDDLFIVF